MNLPELKGTEKQITWANTIRVKFVSEYESSMKRAYSRRAELVNHREKYPEYTDDMIIAGDAKLDTMSMAVELLISTQIKSTFWIDNRDATKAELITLAVGHYLNN